MLRKLTRKPNIAIDLGTANTRMYSFEKGKTVEEPSIVRLVPPNKNEKSSDEFIEYLNSRFISSPLQGGVIIEVNEAISLLKPMIRHALSLRSPVSLACAPTDSTEVERNRLAKAILDAGASEVVIIPEPWAAAVGLGIDMVSRKACMLIDIGEGVTDMIVIKNGRILHTSAIRSACCDLHKALQSAFIGRHRLLPFHDEIEKLTDGIDEVLGAGALSDDSLIKVEGMDVIRRQHATIEVKRDYVVKAMGPVMDRILKMIQRSFRRLSEKTISELMESEIYLTGGGSCIKGMDRLIASTTGVKTRVADDPTHSVINGTIKTLEYWKDKAWWKDIVWPL